MKRLGSKILIVIAAASAAVALWRIHARNFAPPPLAEDKTPLALETKLSVVAEAPAATVSPPARPAARSSDVAAEPETSWARELRELKALAAANADTAFARVSHLREQHERKAAERVVCLVVSEKDPGKAATTAWTFGLGSFDDESKESHVLEILASRWAEADLVKAFTWATTLPPDEEGRRDHVLKGIAATIAQVAPAEAARLVREHITTESSVQTEATMEVVRNWAAQDPRAALAWVSRLGGALGERGLQELANVEAAQQGAKKRDELVY